MSWSKLQAAEGKKRPGAYKPDQKAAYYLENKERIAARRLAERAAARGTTPEAYAADRAAKKAARLAHNGRRSKDQAKAYAQAYYVKNKAKILAMNKALKAKRRQQMPPWADSEKVAAFYVEADRITRETGIEHHVDHIVPLAGALVSGLHCQQNLRVIPADENLAKGNRFNPETYVHPIP